MRTAPSYTSMEVLGKTLVPAFCAKRASSAATATTSPRPGRSEGARWGSVGPTNSPGWRRDSWLAGWRSAVDTRRLGAWWRDEEAI